MLRSRRHALRAITVLAIVAVLLAALPVWRWWSLREPRRLLEPALVAMRGYALGTVGDEDFARGFRAAFANEVSGDSLDFVKRHLRPPPGHRLVVEVDVDVNPSDRFGIAFMPGMATHLVGLETGSPWTPLQIGVAVHSGRAWYVTAGGSSISVDAPGPQSGPAIHIGAPTTAR